jgi:hypothetical protein
MKPSLYVTPAHALVVLVALGCRSSELVAPEASERLAASVQHRTAAQGESIPAIHASAGVGNVTVRVTRHALCATLVSAAVNRGAGEIDVVSHVSNHPAALCAATIPANHLVEYTGTVSSLAVGMHRIRIFESEGNEPAKYIGSMSVTVRAGA